MQSYVGTKIINAKPMTRLEYNSLRVLEDRIRVFAPALV